MKKEVIIKPRGKDFLEFIKEELEFLGSKRAWIYIDQSTIGYLANICGTPYVSSSDQKLHIPYGKIIVDGYQKKYSWYRISSIDSDNVSFSAAADPEEVLFVSISVQPK